MEIKLYSEFYNNDYIIEGKGDSAVKSVIKKIGKDLSLNLSIILTFSTGIGAFIPIVSKLMDNMSISSFEITTENTILLIITALTIIYIEEKNSDGDLKSTAKSLLEELRLRGTGDGTVKKIIEVLKGTKKTFNIFGKYLGKSVYGVVDMFLYTSLMIPVINGISAIIGTYDLTIDSLLQNLFSLGVGMTTLIARNIIVEVIKRLKKSNRKIDSDKILKDFKPIENNIESDNILKFSEYEKDEIINEEQ